MTLEQQFHSDATDEAGVFQDLAGYVMHDYATSGLIPTTTGVNRPEAPVHDADSFLGSVSGWFAQQRAAQGGPATDAYDTPVQQTYAQRRFEALTKEEGVRLQAYDDKTGQPVLPGQKAQGYVTVGAGFNMDAPDAPKLFAAALPGVDYGAVREGRVALNDAQVRQLTDTASKPVEALISKHFAGEDITETQRIALMSLGYNRPAAIPEVADAYKNGGLPAAASAILSQPGDPGRRIRELAQFVGAGNAQSTVGPFIGQRGGGAAAAVDDMKQFLGRPGWNAKVKQYIADGGVGLDPATNAWCAMMVNAALAHQGLPGTGSQLASSFLHFGEAVSDPTDVQKGDVLVAPGTGISGKHVGLATGETRMGPNGLEIEMLAGNDKGGRAGARFHPASELVIRRPSDTMADATNPHETGGPGVIPSFAGPHPDTRGDANYSRPPAPMAPAGTGSFTGKVG